MYWQIDGIKEGAVGGWKKVGEHGHSTGWRAGSPVPRGQGSDRSEREDGSRSERMVKIGCVLYHSIKWYKHDVTQQGKR